MGIAIAKLEAWMRDYYHKVDHDIGSSGVRDLSMAELRTLCGFELSELDSLVLHDSEAYGGPGLRTALADRWTGGDVDPVMVTHGSSEAIYIVMHTLLRAGDEVIVVDPAYQQLYDIAQSKGCRITRWPLRADRGFSPDMELLRKLAASGPRMIVVNFPHNPTGMSISAEEQDELIAIAAESGAWLVWDNAFGEMTYTADPLRLPHDRYDKVISFGTLSKSYGLAGMRVGWCLAPRELHEEMAVLRDYIALYVSPVLEFFAEKAVRNADRIVALQREHAGANLRILRDWADGLPDLVRLTPPDGSVTTFVEFPHLPDVERSCRRLAEEHRVLLVPGMCFGDDFRSYARLGFGGTTAELTAGLSSLEQVLREDSRTVAAR
ncbi:MULTISPECIES: capreomycidine synthase [unclassified Streptomyces]|uniref:capreomycidine synthase n=1 Tax=unclassified Streptomyces TaxID=2593676 RepID=UPI001F04661E|nr:MULTISPECIES: capreomycidine synthase [unclassified Streptomyces]MCH0563646.1 capreomycidine synthase [Streptomyces sp. MUM 2J]MCH0570780.1 capreomycidine synthase [Streptomyces sp. MUM 136J]